MKSNPLLRITFILSSTFCFLHFEAARAATYNVGPSQPLATPNDVPWESLNAGDIVRIHWRSNAYQNKWVICRQGTAASPILIQGIPGPAGQLPVIDGNGATTRLALDYTGETRGVIKIGSANIPSDIMPQYIVIEGLDVRSGRPPFTFTDERNDAGQQQRSYLSAIECSGERRHQSIPAVAGSSLKRGSARASRAVFRAIAEHKRLGERSTIQ